MSRANQPGERLQQEQHMRQRFPFSPNPTGWYAVGHSDELPPATIVELKYFGAPLVLFRTATGRAVVLDAHCPHLGAHLGHGSIEGEGIRCAFHRWCFDSDGKCTDVPYAKKLPRAAVRAWPVRERNGFIFVHFHAARAEPTWELPQLGEHNNDAWTPHVTRRWRIRTDIHEMVENAFDTAHFRYLHQLKNHPDPQISFDGPHFKLRARTEMETPFGVVDGTLDIQSLGFGFGVVRFTGLIETLLLTTITPIDDEYVDARFTFSVKKLPDESATRMLGNGFIDELSKQVEQDIRIWESKVFVARPILVAEDAPIAFFRRWARQFYVAADEMEAEPRRHLAVYR
jgi:nitrite reductase/ring-hydroxylating ferredoxin subunit